MKILNSIEEYNFESLCVLSIGTFDGIHLGHQKIFETMHKVGKERLKVIILLEKPPSVEMERKGKKLINLASKYELLNLHGIDIAINLDLSRKLSRLSYFDFLKSLKQKINFTHLVLGKDAAFGYKKEGTEENIRSLEPLLNFQAIYIPKIEQKNQEISCTAIKMLIEDSDILSASRMLGRKLSLSPSEDDLFLSQDGLTLFIKTNEIILPPKGRYLFKFDDFEIFFEGEIKKTQIEIRVNGKILLDLKKIVRIEISKRCDDKDLL